MRLFAALPLPESLRLRLSLLSAGFPVARPVSHENLHITLVFFDDVSKPEAMELDENLSGIRARAPMLTLSGLDTFGGNKPRQVHASVAVNPALTALQAQVFRAGQAAGLSLPARKYVPHVTLGRGLTGANAAQILTHHGNFRSEPFLVDHFCLYHSHLGRSGPVYDCLAEYPLA